MRRLIIQNNRRNVVRRHARAAAVLELILVLPLLVIALMAVVEFGVWYSNLQCLQMAARGGCETASELPVVAISETSGQPVPAAVVTVVQRTLSTANITYREIVLQHNVTNGIPPEPSSFPVVLITLQPGANPSALVTSPPLPPSSLNTRYMRCTVYANATQLAPNLLKIFGFDLTTRVSQETVTRRYEVLP